MQPDKHKTTEIIPKYDLHSNKLNSSSNFDANKPGYSEDNANIKISDDKLLYKENQYNASNAEDSLLDFKSPKKRIAQKSILNKFKIDNRVKKKILKSKNGSNTKSRINSSDTVQPTIESSFFKQPTCNQNDIKKPILCPLCLKFFQDDASCTNHMKACAKKKNVSLRELFNAKQLQDQLIEEKKAKGLLLPLPNIPGKKKVYRSKDFNREDDPQLQLVLAISESLYQAQQIEELEHNALLTGVPIEYVKNMTDEDHKLTLQKFGFTTNKPQTNLTSKPSKKTKLLGPTILQTRSKEDNERILAEKIAYILTGNDAFTQPQENIEMIPSKSPTILRNKFLREIEQVNNKLWDKSKLLKKCDFYVKDLKPYFVSQENENESSDYENSANDVKDEEQDILSNKSILHEPMECIINEANQELNKSLINESKNECTRFDFKKFVTYNWGKILNDGTESDIIILVKDNKYVYAHKLVFYAQCINILADLEPNESETHPHIKNKICWSKNDELSALAFLEFIYSGDIHKNITVFDNKNLISQIEQLAKSYKVENLFLYLNEQQNQIQSRNSKDHENIKGIDNINNCSNNVNTEQVSINLSTENIKTTVSSEIQIIETINSTQKFVLSMDPEKSGIINDKTSNLSFVKNDFDWQIPESPDLFESGNEEEIYSYNINENNQTQKNMKKSCINHFEYIDHSNPKNSKPFNLLPIDDVHQAVTPKSLSPINCDKNILEMPETLSPQCRSSERYSDIISIKDESESDMIAEAITPEHNVISELNDCITPKKVVYVETLLDDTPDEKIIKNDSIKNISITPSKSNGNDFTSSRKNLHKLKSNLSLFIDKIHKENAKGIFDTDSGTDSEADISNFKTRKKNPFLKKNQNDSFTYLLNDGNESLVHKRGISMLENDVLEEEKNLNKIEYNSKSKKYKKFSNSNELCNLTNEFSDNNLQNDLYDKYKNFDLSSSMCHDELENTTINESRMSMYSRYKKLNKHDNSIDKYRKQLDFNVFPSTSRPILSQRSSIKTRNLITNDIGLCSDSEREESEDSPEIILNDEDVYNKSDLVRNTEKEKNELKLSDTILSNIDSDLYDLINNRSNESFTSTTENSKAILKDNESKIINPIFNSDENSSNRLTYNVAETRNNLSQRNNKVKHEKRLKESAKEIDNIGAAIGRISPSDAFFTAKDRTSLASKIRCQESHQDIDKITNSTSQSSQNRIINLSPISIISSPEHCAFDNDILDKSSESDDLEILESSDKELNSVDVNTTANQEFKEYTINSFAPKDNINQNELSSLSTSLNTSRRASNSQCFSLKNNYTNINISPKLSNSANAYISHFISSPILCQNRQNSKIQVNSNEKERNESLVQLSEKTKKLRVKSVSSYNFKEREHKKCNLQKSSSFETPKQNKKRIQKSNQADVTPPIDYNLLKTPDLEKELRKFGLKRQCRSKAKLLLNHIYNQTHPAVPLSQKRVSISDSSSDEESPFKNQNSRKKFKSNIPKNSESIVVQNLKNCSSRAEEIDNDEPNIADTLENTMSIKDAFFRLIKSNKELYTKVLMYQPLPLEPLHSMLKENGFKCKLKSLKHFLDEQCITFQVQADKSNCIKK